MFWSGIFDVSLSYVVGDNRGWFLIGNNFRFGIVERSEQWGVHIKYIVYVYIYISYGDALQGKHNQTNVSGQWVCESDR